MTLDASTEIDDMERKLKEFYETYRGLQQKFKKN